MFVVFMNIEEGYDGVNREELWEIQEEEEVKNELKCVKKLYESCRAFLKVRRKIGEYF